MSLDLVNEARRQVEICNACRYCEGYCAVFPAITRQRAFADGDITQLANLCHNCRGCYYACQFTEPHEFALNLPGILAEARHESWKTLAWPRGFAAAFERSGLLISAALIVTFCALFGLSTLMQPDGGQGFYAFMSHGLMVGIFVPAFVLPLLAMGVSLRRYGAHVGGPRVRLGDIIAGITSAATMKNLSGGHGQGCNFEDEDRYTNGRKHFHQAVLWGFVMCFGSTASGTVLHYLFNAPAPYGLLSLPKLLGVPGGLLMCLGCLGLIRLKLKADRALGAARIWGGEMAFVVLLFLVGASGLALYATTSTALVALLLPVHLATVLTFFLLTPYSKMAHGFYRLAALAKDAARARKQS